MDEVKEKCLPGTALPYTEQGVEAFSNIEALISVAGGLSLSQVCSITGLEGSTIQNWVKRGWVSNPRGKKYTEAQLSRIIIINALKECIRLESIVQLMNYIGGEVSERELFNYLCQALRVIGRSDGLSGGGIESVVDELISRYEDDTRARLRKALSVMIYACVCSDVKRRTEAMLEEILPSAGETPYAGLEDGGDSASDGETEETLDTGAEPVAEKEPAVAHTRPWFLRRG